MTGIEIQALLLAVFQFPDAMLRLVNLLKKTPVEKHEAMLNALDEAFEHAEKTGDTSQIEDTLG